MLDGSAPESRFKAMEVAGQEHFEGFGDMTGTDEGKTPFHSYLALAIQEYELLLAECRRLRPAQPDASANEVQVPRIKVHMAESRASSGSRAKVSVVGNTRRPSSGPRTEALQVLRAAGESGEVPSSSSAGGGQGGGHTDEAQVPSRTSSVWNLRLSRFMSEKTRQDSNFDLRGPEDHEEVPPTPPAAKDVTASGGATAHGTISGLVSELKVRTSSRRLSGTNSAELQDTRRSNRVTISTLELPAGGVGSQGLGPEELPDPRGSNVSKASFEHSRILSEVPDWWSGSPPDGDPVGRLSSGHEMEAKVEQWLQMEEEASRPPPPDSCTISPVCRARLAWDALWCVLLAYELWLTPFQLFYLSDKSQLPPALGALSWTLLAFFFADITMNFFTGFVDLEKQVLVMNRRQIAANYMRGWFPFDILATLPWDDLTGDGDLLSTVRAARATKVSKALRIFKILKLLRVIKVVRTVRTLKYMSNMKPIQDLEKERKMDMQKALKSGLKSGRFHGIKEHINLFKQKFLLLPAQILLLLVCQAHLCGCLFAAIQPDRFVTEDLEEAWRNYWLSFEWAYDILVFGSVSSFSVTPMAMVLEMCVLFARLLLVGIAAHWVVRQALQHQEKESRLSACNNDAIAYLKDHGVSAETQLSVLNIVRASAEARLMQGNFQKLLQEQIPEEVKRSICQEMWVSKLMSLGLIRHICSWDDRFVLELAQLTREELYATKVCVFKHGDLATAAYHVIKGTIAIMSNVAHERIPPFSAGMWIGEKSLISSGLRRSGLALTRTSSTLMAVPSHGFATLLNNYGLIGKFDQFCSTQLWRGLCGRCGLLGDHFSDECPLLRDHGKGWSWTRFWLKGGAGGNRAVKETIWSSSCDEEPYHLARDLKIFLQRQDLVYLEPVLCSMDITTIDGLQNLPLDALNERLEQDGKPLLTPEQEASITPEAIVMFLSSAASEFRNQIAEEQCVGYTLFLSHYKLEAGTEAALMRTELEHLLGDDVGWDGGESPVFLDSEDLTTLENLQDKVRKSQNLALLLTPNVLTRPWVLVELVTAHTEGIPVLPVQLTKEGNAFKFPDEDFYKRLLDGSLLGDVGMKVINECGFEVSEVCDALRQVLKRITLPYSPHRPASIRRAELYALIQQCSTYSGTGHMKMGKILSTKSRHRQPRSSANSAMDSVGSSYMSSSSRRGSTGMS